MGRKTEPGGESGGWSSEDHESGEPGEPETAFGGSASWFDRLLGGWRSKLSGIRRLLALHDQLRRLYVLRER